METFQPIINSVAAGILIAILSAIGGFFLSKVKSFREERSTMLAVSQKFDIIASEHSTVTRAIRDIIRSSITRVCDEALKNGCIAENQLRNLCELYESYKGLGGNSYIDELFNHTTELPLSGSADPGIEYMKRFGLLDQHLASLDTGAIASTQEIVNSMTQKKG